MLFGVALRIGKSVFIGRMHRHDSPRQLQRVRLGRCVCHAHILRVALHQAPDHLPGLGVARGALLFRSALTIRPTVRGTRARDRGRRATGRLSRVAGTQCSRPHPNDLVLPRERRQYRAASAQCRSDAQILSGESANIRLPRIRTQQRSSN